MSAYSLNRRHKGGEIEFSWSHFLAVVAILCVLCLGVVSCQDGEPKQRHVLDHTYMVYENWTKEAYMSENSDGTYSVNYNYYLFCSEGHKYPVIATWYVETDLVKLKKGQKIRAYNTWFGIDIPRSTVLKKDDDMDDHKLELQYKRQWEKAHAKWERDRKLEEINKFDYFGLYWPLISWGCLSIGLGVLSYSFFLWSSRKLQSTVKRDLSEPIDF